MTNQKIKDLKETQIQQLLFSKEFQTVLDEASKEINIEAKKADTEATIEGVFERVIYALLKDIGIAFHPDKEVFVETRRHMSTGRIDSRIGALIIEYKHRSRLASEKQAEKAKEQLSDYLSSLSEKATNEFIGILTDGLVMYQLRYKNGKKISESGELPLDKTALLFLVKAIRSLNLLELNSKNLIKEFCGANFTGSLFELARTLNKVLEKAPTKKTEMLKSEWEALFRLAHEDLSQQVRIEKRREILSGILQIKANNAEREYNGLFALNTAYAIVLKMLSYRVVSDVKFSKPFQKYKDLTTANSQMLQAFCSSLEDGEIFREIGILNLLEGDFFSWYSDRTQWNTEISCAIKNIFCVLSQYEDTQFIFRSETAIDLFKELYEATVPQIIRASFGEFYTPVWLCTNILEKSISKKDWRLLDPCCGSGTFVVAAISKIKREVVSLSASQQLTNIVNRIFAIDLNPLAVLTTRLNYFLHISELLVEDNPIVIPVFLGDAAYVPETIKIDNVSCLQYELRTIKTPITIQLPISLVQDTAAFVIIMYEYERLVKSQKVDAGVKLLIKHIPVQDRKDEVINNIKRLTEQLVDLERKNWDGIWARIITNFLTTACIGKFSNVIGNPPWIDWKNLPTGYRERIKKLCIDKGLFSGAGRTGGINLNICALISNVVITNWLEDDGMLSFLMPKELAQQASYEGWRKSVGGEKHNILCFHDWSQAGYPFFPVKEDFMTFFIGASKALSSVKVFKYKKKEGVEKTANLWTLQEAIENLECVPCIAGRIIPNSTIYTFARNEEQLKRFSKVAGKCSYIGREGIEFYPQELLLFFHDRDGPRKELVIVKNIQVKKSKYKIPKQNVIIEKRFLYPLIRGRTIEKFRYERENILVPFPYEETSPTKPLEQNRLEKEGRFLLNYYKKYETTIRAQTPFSDKIRGPNAGDFYGLARTGPYSFGKVFVAFRDNTKWGACVVSKESVPWGEKKSVLFQNHAVSMCERADGSGNIIPVEAFYICGILNTPTVEEFIYASSDNRSFKIRPPVFVPSFDPKNKTHQKIAGLSFLAHKYAQKEKDTADIVKRIEELYFSL